MEECLYFQKKFERDMYVVIYVGICFNLEFFCGSCLYTSRVSASLSDRYVFVNLWSVSAGAPKFVDLVNKTGWCPVFFIFL